MTTLNAIYPSSMFNVNQPNRGNQAMKILIVGAGFAGMYASLSAARLRDEQGVSPEPLEIAVVAQERTTRKSLSDIDSQPLQT
jgi:hypothetical protein